MYMVQLMPLPLTVSGFSKIQIGFTFLILAHSPRKRAFKWVLSLLLLEDKQIRADLFNSLCITGQNNFKNKLGTIKRSAQLADCSTHTMDP